MDAAACAEWGADVGVVDSYRIPATDVSAWARDLPALAIVDGGTRGIEAALYLDQNLGAEDRGAPIPAGSRMLAGAAYALVRSDVLAARRVDPWRASSTGRPRLLAVMGGTDATGAIVAVADAVAALGPARRRHPDRRRRPPRDRRGAARSDADGAGHPPHPRPRGALRGDRRRRLGRGGNQLVGGLHPGLARGDGRRRRQPGGLPARDGAPRSRRGRRRQRRPARRSPGSAPRSSASCPTRIIAGACRSVPARCSTATARGGWPKRSSRSCPAPAA